MTAPAYSVGEILADEISQPARGPVDPATIALWCAAVRDANPRHWGAPAEIVAPPAMVGTWTQRPPWTPTAAPARAMELHHRLKQALDLPNAVVKEVTHHYGVPVRCGDIISARHRIGDLGEQRISKLGEGRDWTVRVVYRNQRGELVAVEDWSFHAYRQTPEPTPHNGAAERAADNTRSPVDPAAALLPELRVDVTEALVIQTAAASADWTPFHHDRAHARRIGLSDIILNTPGHLALLSRWLDESVAPRSRPLRVSLRLHASAVPGDRLTLGGRLASESTISDRWRRVDVDLEERIADRPTAAGRAVVVTGSAADDPWTIPPDLWIAWAETGEPFVEISSADPSSAEPSFQTNGSM